MKDTLTEIKQSEGGDDPDDTQHRGNPQHQTHVPGLGLILVMNVVISDGQDGSVVEQRQYHDHHRRQWIEVEHQDRQRHEQQHAQRLSNTVDRIAVHPLERFSALLDRVDNHRQAGRHQHDGCRRARGVRGAGNGDAAVSFLQRGGVVHPVARHADNVAALLQHVHDMELVFGEYLGKTVGFFDGLRRLGRFVMLYVAQTAGVENRRAHP